MCEIPDMDVDAELVLPHEYTLFPLKALRMAARRKLAGYLDLEGALVVCGESDVVNDWSGLAELAGFSYIDIMNMKRQRSPTTELLDQWTSKINACVGKLWGFLYMMEREDVLIDCRRAVVNDCRIWAEQEEIARDALQMPMEQDPTVSTSEMKVNETKYSTVQDIQNRQQTMYDAFICYTPEDDDDRKFVREIIDELEKRRGLKLFVPGRDDIPGAAEYTITAYLIEVRCRRVVILMSKKFLQSQVCDFQVKFAHALAPGARSKKLIPIIRERNITMPRILRFLAVCDFTKIDMREWVWDRLYAAISAPVGPVTYFEPEDPYNPFQEEDMSLQNIKFPEVKRLGNGSDNETTENREVEENEEKSGECESKMPTQYGSLPTPTQFSSVPTRPPPQPPKKKKGFSVFRRKKDSRDKDNSEISSTGRISDSL